MVSKERKKKLQQKQWNTNNREEMKRKGHKGYMQNREEVKERAKSRMTTDHTLRKQNSQRVKARLLTDNEYRQRNKERAAINDRRKHTNPESRAQHLAKLRDRMKRKLTTDEQYHKYLKARLRLNEAARLQDEQYRQKHRERLRQNAKSRLQDEQYRQKHRERLRQNAKTRLQNDKYRQQHRDNMRSKYNKEISYKDSNKMRAKQRHERLRGSEKQRQYHRAVVSVGREEQISPVHVRRQMVKQRLRRKLSTTGTRQMVKRLTPQQRYWQRRSRLLAVARQRSSARMLQHKMNTESGYSILDIELLFKKAENELHNAEVKAKSMHKKLACQATDFLQYLPANEQVTEDHLLTAFEGIRLHSSAGETYFYDHSYRVLPANSTIAVDECGKARLFDIVEQPVLSADEIAQMPKTVRWHCNPELCRIGQQSINGVTALFTAIATLPSNQCCSFYHHLDDCSNPARNDHKGHTLYCAPDSQCHSLLRPARAIASHFPVMRSYVRRLYEVRQLVRHMEAVESAMASGKYDKLREATDNLVDLTNKLVSGKDGEKSGTQSEGERAVVNEEALMSEFGDALRQVETARDTYVTTSCDVCEQLRNDIQPLKSYEGKKGYDSDKLTDILDLLCQTKTNYEDYDSFLKALTSASTLLTDYELTKM